MGKVRWTKQAIEDIYEIREYYVDLSPKYADQLTDKIFEKADYLEQHSRIGRIVPELEREDVRELIYKNYRVIYRIISKKQIDIIAVHNSARPLSEDSIFG